MEKKEIGKLIIETLLEELKDEDIVVRKNAAKTLGQIKDNSSVEALLGQIKDNSSVEALIEALKDKSALVRKTAAKSLGKIKDNSSIEALIEALKDKSKNVRYNAAEALMEMNILIEPQVNTIDI